MNGNEHCRFDGNLTCSFGSCTKECPKNGHNIREDKNDRKINQT